MTAIDDEPFEPRPSCIFCCGDGFIACNGFRATRQHCEGSGCEPEARPEPTEAEIDDLRARVEPLEAFTNDIRAIVDDANTEGPPSADALLDAMETALARLDGGAQ